MPRPQAAELLEGRQPLPPQGAEPGGQEAPGVPVKNSIYLSHLNFPHRLHC